jgi:hypothetical protein
MVDASAENRTSIAVGPLSNLGKHLAWVLTLPATIVISGALDVVFRHLF